MATIVDTWVEECRNGTNPRLITRLKSGWAVMGEVQVVPGYCLLLPDPVPAHLNEMREPDQIQFLTDMAHLGQALLQATDALRINYEMLGNQQPALHAHLFPRYDAEPEDMGVKPVWFYDWDNAPRWSPEVFGHLQMALREALSIPAEKS